MGQAKAAASIRFEGALLVTQDPERRVLRGDLEVRDGRITAVGRSTGEAVEQTVDARRRAIVPGFINLHGHVAMTLLRGIADDRDLGGFLERLFALDARRTEQDLEAGAALGVAEMLLGGTTSFLDLYYGEDAVARAVSALGIRGYLGWAVLDADKSTQKGRPIDNAAAFIGRWSADRLVRPLVAPQGVYVCSEETWLAARDVSQKSGTLLHYHLSETRREVHEHERLTGRRPPLWLESIGALGPKQVAAHGVWLTRAEIELLARRGVAVAHCPSSNLKLATGGVCPVVELREVGAAVGLGTDSAASNNSLSMLHEMRVAGLLQKHHRWDAAALPAGTLLDLATIEGARALGAEQELGSLQVGKRADFSLFDLGHSSLSPARPEAIVSHLAYSASDEAVDSVYVDGTCVVEHRRVCARPWEEIRTTAETAAEALWVP